jgi:dephospho-CoA kinase
MAKPGNQAELNRRLLARLKPHRDHAIDGLRHPIDWNALSAEFGSDFYLIYVDAPEVTRRKRTIGDGRFRSITDFHSADHHLVEQSLGALRARAYATLENNGTLDAYYAALDLMTNKILTSYEVKSE